MSEKITFKQIIILFALFVAGVPSAVLISAFAPQIAEIPLRAEGEGLSAVLRNFGLVLGGFLGLYLAFRRTNTATRQQETAAEQQRLAEQGQITDRYAKAVEMLGNKENETVRIGALYALERIAIDSQERDAKNIKNLLATFMQEQTVTEQTKDLIVAFEVLLNICRFGEQYELNHVSFEGVQFHLLRHGNEMAGINFRNCIFDNCEFHTIRLNDIEFKQCRFSDCEFIGGHYESCKFTRCKIRTSYFWFLVFRQCEFVGGYLFECGLLYVQFPKSKLERVDISKSVFVFDDELFGEQKYYLTQVQLNMAIAYEDMLPTLPEGLKMNPARIRSASDRGKDEYL